MYWYTVLFLQDRTEINENLGCLSQTNICNSRLTGKLDTCGVGKMSKDDSAMGVVHVCMCYFYVYIADETVTVQIIKCASRQTPECQSVSLNKVRFKTFICM